MLDFLTPSTPRFVVTFGVVETVNPYAHTYGVIPLWKPIRKSPLVLAIPIGMLGNSASGVQLQASYNYGDRVLILYQENYSEVDGSPLCYILGAATPKLFRGQAVEDYVDGFVWDSKNLSIDNFEGFELVDKTVQLQQYMDTACGHGSVDMLPGDFEATGQRVSLMVGDYFAGIHAYQAEFFIDSIYRRVVERSLLRSVTTASTLEDTALIGNTTIASTYTKGHFTALEKERSEDAVDDEIDTQDSYRTITQEGDLLYGTHKTLLSEDGTTPLAQDYLGYDGTRHIYTASRLCIGKIPGMESPIYTGPRLNTYTQQTKVDTKDPTYPVKIEADEKDWVVKSNSALLLDDWYPESFLSPEDSEYVDDSKKNVTLEDTLAGKDISLNNRHSYIDFQDDGSIKIIDGWGSYILLSHGNVEIHAMNNLFMVSARDTLNFAGANRTDYAGCDVSIQAYSGTLRATAGNKLSMLSGAAGRGGDLVIESANGIRVIGKTYNNDAQSVVFTVRNSDTQMTGGQFFQVLVPGGQINLSGNVVRANGNSVTLTSDLSALSITNGVAIAGSVSIKGGICCDRGNLQLPIVTQYGKVTTKTFSTGGFTEIVNKQGGLRVNGDIITTRQILAVSNICGLRYSLLGSGKQKEINPTRNRESLLSLARNLPTLNISAPSIDDDDLEELIAAEDTGEYRFDFGKESKNCMFKLGRKMPKSTISTVKNTGYVDHKGITQYIYPGKGFWEASGLRGTDDIRRGFNTLVNAPANNS